MIVEHTYDTKPMHQGYIEPQSCVANVSDDGQVELWCCTQAPWVYRDRLTEILKLEFVENPHPAVGTRRRLRRQDDVLHGAGRHRAVEEGQRAGENDADPRRGAEGDGPGVRHADAHQDGLQEGRHDRRGGLPN